MPVKFERKEIEKLKDVLKYHPEGKAAADVITSLMDLQDLSNNLRYPVNSFSDLEKQLGHDNPDKIIKYGRIEVKISDLRSKVPSYYFPISSEEDFFDKSSELIKLKGTETTSPISGIATGNLTPFFMEGQEVSRAMAPALPDALIRLQPPAQIPANGSLCVTKDQLKALLTPAEFERLNNI